MAENGRHRPTVALLGTGIMGTGMARSMLRAGLPLRVWNRTLAKAEPLAADGATVAENPADAVRGADVIVTMLPDADIVRQTIAKAAPGLREDQVWAQASTVGVPGTDQLARVAGQRGLVFVDCPVLGTRKPAEDGTLVVFAAGPREAAGRVQPVFDAIGAKTLWVGDAGTASRLKLVANSWVLAVNTATAETMALARGLGVDPAQFLDAISGGPLDCAYMRMKAAAILEEDFTPSFSVTLAHKDAELVFSAGQSGGVLTDVADASVRKLARAAEQGHADQDMAAAYFGSFSG
jgi:3-hydroxyisobutyrate dehydrogenase